MVRRIAVTGLQTAGFVAIVASLYLIEPWILLGVGGLVAIITGQVLSRE